MSSLLRRAALLVALCAAATFARAETVLDLTGWDPASGPHALDGQWEFTAGRLLGPGDPWPNDTTLVTVPHEWSGQAGLRLENTIAKGQQVTNDSTFTRNYTNLFPTMYLTYDVNKNHSLTLSYGRRIERPNYQDLNPFVWFLDSLTYRQGNPYLLPQYANNIEFRHTYKGRYTTTLNYTRTDDVISQLLKQNTEQKITFLTTDNVARFTNIGIAINAPFTVVKGWNVNLFVNVYNNRYQGVYFNSYTGKNDPIDLNYTSATLNISNTFNFNKK